MSENINALASLLVALATLVTAIGGLWIGIANNRKMRQVHDNTSSMQDDINQVQGGINQVKGDIKQVKGDMFSLTAVMTQSIAPMKKDP